MEQEKTIVQIIEEVCSDICRNYCKYPELWDKEEEGIELCDSKLCSNCPLNKLQ